MCVCVRAYVRACVRACVRAGVCVCECVRAYIRVCVRLTLYVSVRLSHYFVLFYFLLVVVVVVAVAMVVETMVPAWFASCLLFCSVRQLGWAAGRTKASRGTKLG